MTRLFACLAAIFLATSATAGTATDLVFREGVFDDFKSGTRIAYTHSISGPEETGFRAFDNGTVTIGLEDGGARVIQRVGEKIRRQNQFPSGAGNPLVMMFLESAVRSMALKTGGSQFYIRNRVKEAVFNRGEIADREMVVNGDTIPAQEVTFKPFAGDPNRIKMGAFADMTLSFIVSSNVPGGILSLEARTIEGGPYNEVITFEGLEE